VRGFLLWLSKARRGAPSGDLVERGNGQLTEIGLNSIVRLVSDPSRKGVVMAVVGEGEDVRYTVFIDGEMRTFYFGQIEPAAARTTNWVDRDTFRSYLTACLINRPSSRSLYSLNSARIDFVPYQFRPALKILKAEEPKILIADSVGVGKTIEAGLIIKELQAHSGLNRVAIVCPKALVSERKWEDEMREKFDEEFVPFNGQMLRQALSDTERDGEWPVKWNKVILPYSILDEMAFEGNGEKVGGKARGRVYGFKDVAKDWHFDLVIVDEAHHIRNGSNEKEKAFAYKCVKFMCERSDAVVMLTATPLQNTNHDLYTLLNVLRPDVVIDYDTFLKMSEPNPFIAQASKAARGGSVGWQDAVRTAFDALEKTFWGREVTTQMPLYKKLKSALDKPEFTREERVKFITDVESLHSFNSMINRTRRRDIEDFCVREPVTLKSHFTVAQQALHDELLAFEHQALALLHGDRGIPFMMTTIRRQAASCIFGLAPHLRAILKFRLYQLANGTDESGNLMGAGVVQALEEMSKKVLSMAERLPPEDPKFDDVLVAIQKKQSQPKNKIILFSTFKYTLDYIERKLKETNIRVARVDGDTKDEDRRGIRDRFKLPKDDPHAIDILLFTEVGSEGLDYQFCDMMINYDLPWNPMAIEQRIGRIDRRKQESEKVTIVNAITEGTVDADIYDRCYAKIGIFESSIGECEEILGEIGEDLTKIAMDGKLTDEQRRAKIEQLSDNQARRVQEEMRLEEEQKSFFGLDISNFKDNRDIEEAKSPWLTPRCLQGISEHYLNDRLGAGSYFVGTGLKKSIRLSREAKEMLLEDLHALHEKPSSIKRAWEAYLKGPEPTHPVVFDVAASKENPTAFFLSPVHPLVRAAAAKCKPGDVSNVPCISFRCAIPDVSPGRYPFAVYAWSYKGYTDSFKMVTVPLDARLDDRLPGIVKDAETFDFPGGDVADLWDKLEPMHTRLWKEGIRKYREEINDLKLNKLQALLSSHVRKIKMYEDKLVQSVDERLTRMYRSMIDDENERYDIRRKQIEDKAACADILVDKIANGVIMVEG